MAAVVNSRSGRRTGVSPQRLNPYRGIGGRQEPAEDDLDDVFGITE